MFKKLTQEDIDSAVASAVNETRKENDGRVKELELNHNIEVKELESNHKLELKQKEFDIKHFKDEEMKALGAKVGEKDQKIAVLEKENEMLKKITDLNADVIDVKDLVTQLIKKLPEVNITSLSVQQPATK